MQTQALVVSVAGGQLETAAIDLPELADDQVEIEVDACAICHSDLHLIDDDWGISRFPLVAGHEIVGRVAALGPAAKSAGRLSIGDVVGVGWQCGACHQCAPCVAGMEQLCEGGKRRTAVDQAGGFAKRVRTSHRFATRVPPELSPVQAAPLFCAGVTVFAPLTRHIDRRGMRVGIVGLGGLGHLAVQIAAALGARVSVFDPVESKEAEALAFGATDFFSDPRAAMAPFDLLLTTTSADLPWNEWLGRLALGGTLCLVGVPKKPLTIAADHLLDGQKIVTGSVIGSPADMKALLAFAVQHGIRPKIETFAWQDAADALARMRDGSIRYRAVLQFTSR